MAETIVRLLELGDRLDAVERVRFAGYCEASGTGMVQAMRRAIGRDVPERAFPWWLMRLPAPFGGSAREVVEIRPYWRHPVRLDNYRLVALIGEEPRTLFDAAIATTLAAFRCLYRPSGQAPQAI